MAGLINIQPIDTPDVDQTQFGDDMKRWLANMTDVINSNFTALSEALAITSATIAGAGLTRTVAVPGLTAAGTVTVNLLLSTNPSSIVSVAPGVNQFVITFSADPGGSVTIQYAAYAVGAQ